MHVDEALHKAMEAYAADRPISRGLADRASRVMPGGNTRSVLDMEPFAFRADHVDGAHIVDVDGHRMLDLLGNYSAGLLGHGPDAVATALHERIDQGWTIGAMGLDEITFAEAVVSRFAGIEQVRFTNSGTEANLMALMTARHVTGRDRVVVFDGAYHGGLAYFGASGGPLRAPFDWLVLPYNDPDALAEALADHGPDVACVLAEPMMGAGGCIPATPEFMTALRAETTRHGCLLVLDEVMTSRMAVGGAQELLGVEADLTVLGKYLAGGLSFGAFGGRRDVMAAFDPAVGGLTHGGTFNNNALSMAAGVAASELVADGAALAALFDRGERLRSALAGVLEASPLPLSVTGWGSLLTLHAANGPLKSASDVGQRDERLQALLFHHLLAAGFLIAARGYLAIGMAVEQTGLDALVAEVAAFCDLHADLTLRAQVVVATHRLDERQR